MQLRHYWYFERTGSARSTTRLLTTSWARLTSEVFTINSAREPVLHRSPPWQRSDQV